MTFKAYVTATINKLTYVSFHKLGSEQTSVEVGNFVAVLLQIYLSICMTKIIKNRSDAIFASQWSLFAKTAATTDKNQKQNRWSKQPLDSS